MHISFTKRVAFIKSVAQTLPTYKLITFLLPKATCTEIMTCKFWWGSIGFENIIHWTHWFFFYLPKEIGELDLNIYMLSK